MPHTLLFIRADRTGDWKGALLRAYLLTYSTVQSPSWEANLSAASQEIPHISRNPKVHYRIHRRPPPVSILGQPNPVHIHISHLLEIRSNIIRPSTPRSPHWSPSLRFSPPRPYTLASPHPYAPYESYQRNLPFKSKASRTIGSITNRLAPRYCPAMTTDKMWQSKRR